MLSEVRIKKMIPTILKQLGGVATKKEICDFLATHCSLDEEDDLAKSNSRNEPKYVQRVGNIISHAKGKNVSDCIQVGKFELVRNSCQIGDGATEWLFRLPSCAPHQSILFVEDEED